MSATNESRTKMVNTANDRWSIGAKLETLYNDGAGSIYTDQPAGNLPTTGSGPKLNTQLKKGRNGVNFFGYGRAGGSAGRLGSQGQSDEGNVKVGGETSTRGNINAGRGDTSKIGGAFHTYRKAREAVSDYGPDSELCGRDSSWFTQGVSNAVKYGFAFSFGGKNGGGRGGNTRGGSNAEGKQGGGSAQSKY